MCGYLAKDEQTSSSFLSRFRNQIRRIGDELEKGLLEYLSLSLVVKSSSEKREMEKIRMKSGKEGERERKRVKEKERERERNIETILDIRFSHRLSLSFWESVYTFNNDLFLSLIERLAETLSLALLTPFEWYSHRTPFLPCFERKERELRVDISDGSASGHVSALHVRAVLPEGEEGDVKEEEEKENGESERERESERVSLIKVFSQILSLSLKELLAVDLSLFPPSQHPSYSSQQQQSEQQQPQHDSISSLSLSLLGTHLWRICGEKLTQFLYETSLPDYVWDVPSYLLSLSSNLSELRRLSSLSELLPSSSINSLPSLSHEHALEAFWIHKRQRLLSLTQHLFRTCEFNVYEWERSRQDKQERPPQYEGNTQFAHFLHNSVSLSFFQDVSNSISETAFLFSRLIYEVLFEASFVDSSSVRCVSSSSSSSSISLSFILSLSFSLSLSLCPILSSPNTSLSFSYSLSSHPHSPYLSLPLL